MYSPTMAGRGGSKQTDGVLVARLHGTARRIATEKPATEVAIGELLAITTRVELLSWAAGVHMAMFRSGSSPFSREAADFLLAAGADLGQAEVEAAAVVAAEAPVDVAPRVSVVSRPLEGRIPFSGDASHATTAPRLQHRLRQRERSAYARSP